MSAAGSQRSRYKEDGERMNATQNNTGGNMQGFPKWFNTRADVEHCLKEYPEQMKAQLTTWLNDRYSWQATAQLASKDAGTEDETHRIEEREDSSIWQLEWVEKTADHLSRLGITVEEAEIKTALEEELVKI
jgi:hypothetical protein